MSIKVVLGPRVALRILFATQNHTAWFSRCGRHAASIRTWIPRGGGARQRATHPTTTALQILQRPGTMQHTYAAWKRYDVSHNVNVGRIARLICARYKTPGTSETVALHMMQRVMTMRPIRLAATTTFHRKVESRHREFQGHPKKFPFWLWWLQRPVLKPGGYCTRYREVACLACSPRAAG